MNSISEKPLIAPFQKILLKKGKCVACLTNLKEGNKIGIDENSEEVTCKCGRIYIHNLSDDSYRRALLSEI